MGSKAAGVGVIVLATIFYPVLCYTYGWIELDGPVDKLFCSWIGLLVWFGVWYGLAIHLLRKR